MTIEPECCSGNQKCDANAKIETVVSCKATASLNEEVKEELKEQDKPIGEVIDNAQDSQ